MSVSAREDGAASRPCVAVGVDVGVDACVVGCLQQARCDGSESVEKENERNEEWWWEETESRRVG